MDRNLVNNQIILMRKIVRNVKRLVKQKLIKQMKKLELRLKKQVKNNTKKLENKIKNKRKELISINGVNVDEVSKLSLVESKQYFEDIIKSSQSTPESKALARIAINEIIAKVVNKFKDENPNCDQWLPSQIELWQQKKLIKKNKIMRRKGLIGKDYKSSENNKQLNAETEEKSPEKNEILSKVSQKLKTKEENDKKVSKYKTKIAIKKPKASVLKEEKEMKVTEEPKKPKSDPFFLSKDSNIDEESDANSDKEFKMRPKNSFNEKSRKNEKKIKFSKTSAKSHSIPNKNFKPKKFEKTSLRENKSKVKEEVLHPSWAAKRSAKDKLKINLNERPMAKKIKFNDQ